MSDDVEAGTEGVEGEQLSLLGPRVPRHRRAATVPGIADVDPVAVVQVDTGLAHLDRPFDYLVPADLADQAQPGVRVKVRFSGRDLDGFVLERRAETDHDGQLRPLRRVVSPEPVLTPAVLEACRAVARHYAGPLGDVLRLAVPPRHAAAEKALPTEVEEDVPDSVSEPTSWEPYAAGPAFLGRVRSGEAPAAALLVVPGHGDLRVLAEAAAQARVAGRGAVLVVPDARDVARLEAHLVEVIGPGHHVRLTADQGPQARYTAYLKVLRGHVRIVIGTRAAAFAPVRDLGLLAWWDDGDSSLDEPRAPYPHVREVLALRAGLEGAALLAAGWTRSVVVEQWVREDRLKSIAAPRGLVRRSTARVRVASDETEGARDVSGAHARLPTLAWRTAKEALARGPVLVQVPRRGYVPALTCQDCRRPARCRECSGPLRLTEAGGTLACGWCGRVALTHRCVHCDSPRLRASVVGARRTAEEMGRAFPGIPVTTSGGATIVDDVDDRPRLVVATPGAEPVAEGGYAAGLFLDAWALLDRPGLDAGEDAVRRWLNAGALVRGSADGGLIVLVGSPSHVTVPAVEALVRWDPQWFADRELDERAQLSLPPAVALATVTGARRDVVAAVDGAVWPTGTKVLGPLPVTGDGAERLVVTAPRPEQSGLAEALRQVRSRVSARRDGETVQIRKDAPDPAG